MRQHGDILCYPKKHVVIQTPRPIHFIPYRYENSKKWHIPMNAPAQTKVKKLIKPISKRLSSL